MKQIREINRKKTDIFIEKIFKSYYRNIKDNYPEITALQNREFAFLYFDFPGMNRHMAFPSKQEMVNHLIKRVPRHCYRSASYYHSPIRDNMGDKDYFGCDFVVDIDSDHIPTPCIDTHNSIHCKNPDCNWSIKGNKKPKVCPECGNTKFNEIAWICDECLEVTKVQVKNLIDNFLTKEFGIGYEDIKVDFSGHRGYHVQLELDDFKQLDSEARREITDYVTGKGLSYSDLGFKKTQGSMLGFSTKQPGWPGKIAEKFSSVLGGSDDSIYAFFKNPRYGSGIGDSYIKLLTNNRKELVWNMKKYPASWQVRKIGDKTWYHIVDILKQSIISDIDVVVSYDLHRLFRLEGSLHGKSGFKKTHVPIDELDDFNPLNDALAFGNDSEFTIKLNAINHIPEIKIADETYGPFFEGETIQIPLNAGLFLLCKNMVIVPQSDN